MTKATEIRNTAAGLPKKDRAELAAFLLGGLDDTHYWIDDEEVQKRSKELDSGRENGLTQKEFMKACGRE
jgi:hypothetical protein